MKRNKPVSDKELIVRITIAIILSAAFVLAFASAFGQTVSIIIPNDTSKVEVVKNTDWLIIHHSKIRKLKKGYDNNEFNKQKFEACEAHKEVIEAERDTCRFNNKIYREVITVCDELVDKIEDSLDKAEKEHNKRERGHRFLNALRTSVEIILVGVIIIVAII